MTVETINKTNAVTPTASNDDDGTDRAASDETTAAASNDEMKRIIAQRDEYKSKFKAAEEQLSDLEQMRAELDELRSFREEAQGNFKTSLESEKKKTQRLQRELTSATTTIEGMRKRSRTEQLEKLVLQGAANADLARTLLHGLAATDKVDLAPNFENEDGELDDDGKAKLSDYAEQLREKIADRHPGTYRRGVQRTDTVGTTLGSTGRASSGTSGKAGVWIGNVRVG